MKRFFRFVFVALLAGPGALFAQGEKYFKEAKVAIQLEPDSVKVRVVARAEDLMNTVHVFPGNNTDKAPFLLYEKRIEAYFQERIPVWIDGKQLYLKVVQWKPNGRGPGDGFDSASLNVIYQTITLGGRLPGNPEHLQVRADLWVERTDADATTVEFSLLQGGLILRRLSSRTEKTWKFPISPDSLAAMRLHLPSQKREPFMDEGDPD